VTPFILICALLVAVGVALLVWPLLKPRATAAVEPPRAGIAATFVAAALPLAAFAGYFWASDWPWTQPQVAAHPAAASDIERMLAQLQQRLTQQPENIEGWKLLGRSATVTGNYAVARDAYAQAYTRSNGLDADAVVGYAEALVLNDERQIDGQAAQLFERAIAMTPDNARALWYGGIVAYRRGDLALARQRWVELQNHELPPDLRQMLAERLSEIEVTQAGATGAAAPKAPTRPTTPATTPAPVAGEAGVAIRVSVQIAPALAAQVTPQSILFVFARRGEAGPPLAAVRRPVGAWPVTLTISDANAMLPGISLAEGGPLRLIARITRSGQPTAVSGDLYGEVSYDFTATGSVTLTINQVVP
jgi:cytochrome c-type biogenesis protein CcmH